MARLRAPAPFAGRADGGAALGVNCDPPLTILNFSGLPVALRRASCTMRLGPSPSATSTMTCDMATFTETSWLRTLHSPDSRLCASICWPASSRAPRTAFRATSGVTSSVASAGGSSLAIATATATDDSIAVLATGVLPATLLGVPTSALVIAGVSALGSLLRLRSDSNGDGPLNGDVAAPRDEEASGADVLVAAGALRATAVLAFPGSELPLRETVPRGFAAS